MTAPSLLVRDVPTLYRGIARAAVHSRAAAVKLFCLQCVGYVRADITGCTAPHCALYVWRPYQPGDDDQAPPEIPGVEAADTTIAGSDISKDLHEVSR